MIRMKHEEEILIKIAKSIFEQKGLELDCTQMEVLD